MPLASKWMFNTAQLMLMLLCLTVELPDQARGFTSWLVIWLSMTSCRPGGLYWISVVMV